MPLKSPIGSSRKFFCQKYLLLWKKEDIGVDFNTPQQAPGDVNTSLQHCGSCTGYLCPVRQRIQHKLASLAFRALSGLAPDYLAGDCQLVADSGR